MNHPGPVLNQFPSRPSSYRLAFIGESPGDDEVRLHYPFAGAAGRSLNRHLSRVGLSREEVFVGNVCQHKPSPSSNEFALFAWTEDVVQEGISQLLQDLATFQPNLVVTLGNVPLHLFRHGNVDPGKTPKSGFKWPSKVTSWRGSLFMSVEFTSSDDLLVSRASEIQVTRPENQSIAAGLSGNGLSAVATTGEPTQLVRNASRLTFKCLSTWHPAFILRAPVKNLDFHWDLGRAVEEGRSPVLTLPALDIQWGPEREVEPATEPSVEPMATPTP